MLTCDKDSKFLLIIKENYLEIEEVTMNRLYQKKAISAFVLEKVEEMKMQSSSTVGY